MTKKSNKKHWTVEIAEIRESIRKIQGKKNKIGHLRWLLGRKNLSLSNQIVNLENMEAELMAKHSKVAYTPPPDIERLEKEWTRKCREFGVDRLIE